MKKRIAFALLALIFSELCFAQVYEPTAENLENREWYQDAKFGMFIHWGVYSVLGVHEWVMETKSIDKKTYEKLPAFFNPTEFDAEEWVLLAKSAGMKYITITTKHHDGFAMFDSKLSDWDIMDRTVYKKDVIKQMAEACRKHGLKLFLYYSQLDWHHNDYYPRGDTGKKAGRPDSGNWEDYLDYMNGQLTELLTNYGDVGGIWFDGWWDKKEADWQLRKTYDLIHGLQPQAMIGSNHHQAPNPGEDFQMFERDLPGENKGGYSADAKVGKLPLETAETMAHQWGFSLQDKAYKSSKELIQYLVRAAGYNSNFLLNVGPMPNGKIQPEFIDTLKVVGNWTDKYGSTIYGTRGGPVAAQSWGVTTQKNDKIFVHITDWKTNNFLLPTIDGDIENVTDFQTKQKLKHTTNSYGTLVSLPKDRDYDLPDFVLEVRLK
ncbi:alpha-L-fucosidase [Muricauda oceani]|uniref:alpha-L-fucosidase n=1 Tax=Flagellimonas oceani TaxID=2698672 RepID=A0A6G7J330_9FLAO|nr:alpha-L-fucosidase [Allomuricauda oceani]MBW8243891.1 alpha-L-fucosidase [Allomuricauda oceani]QII44877.1 alpha-L-fucosidase [Allomuricauda oceani]